MFWTRAKRLEQIVHRAEVKGLNGVCIIGRGKHNRGDLVETCYDFRTGQPRHPDVQEKQLRASRYGRGKRFLAVMTDSRDPQQGHRANVIAQLVPCERFIVRDDDGDHEPIC